MELVDVYNERRTIIGEPKTKKEFIDGEYWVSEFIWIINDSNQILIQQRAATCNKFPNIWGATAGAKKALESPINGAIRELQEEMGITAEVSNMEYLGSQKRVGNFCDIWLYTWNGDIKDLRLQSEEVQNAKWVTIEEFEKMLESGQAIRSGYNLFKIYYENYYKRYYIVENGQFILKKR